MVTGRKIKKVKDLFVKKCKPITQMLMSTTKCFMISRRVTRTETRSGHPSMTHRSGSGHTRARELAANILVITI